VNRQDAKSAKRDRRVKSVLKSGNFWEILGSLAMVHGWMNENGVRASAGAVFGFERATHSPQFEEWSENCLAEVVDTRGEER
jgi:hypothetical protein